MNFKSLRFLLTTLVLAVLVSGCGGGGGGGGGGSASASAETGVRVLHGAIDATPADVTVATITGQAVVVSGGKFGEPTLYGALAVGPQSITMTRALTPSVVIGSQTIEVGERQRFTYLLYGDNASFGLSARVFSDDPGVYTDGEGKIRVINGVTGAARVTVSVDGKIVGEASFGGSLDYISLAIGIHQVSLRRSADNASLGSVQVTVQAESASTIFVAGEIDYYTKVSLVSDTD